MTRQHHIIVSFCVLVGALASCAAPVFASESGETCPNEQLRSEQPYGLELPDCRAYELVSPIAKGDGSVSPVDSRASVSDGSPAIAYLSPGSFANPSSALLESRYLSRRGADGWSTENISPPYIDYEQNALHPPFAESVFTPDLSEGIVLSAYTPLVAGEPAGYINLYVADTEDGSYRSVSTFTPEEEHAPFSVNHEGVERPQVEGGSTDLSSVVFQQYRRAEKGSMPHEHIYEGTGGEPVLVDVAPPGVKFEGEDNVGAPANFAEPEITGNTWHAVSGSGSAVFFTAQEGPGFPDMGQLFVRLNPLAPQSPYVGGRCSVAVDACTVEVSASQRTNANGEADPDPHGPQFAFYRDASADGSRVFFTSRAELTNDAFTGPEDNAANLYEYDVESGVLTDLTVAENTESSNGAAVLGLVTAGEDGSYVYFVANGVLAEGAKPGNCRVEEQEAPVVGGRSCNLYVVHDGADGWEAPRFIATLAGSNNARGFAKGELQANQVGDEGVWAGYENQSLAHDWGPGFHSARVSEDGRVLAFESELSLTGFDNVPVKAGACGETGRCREVYLYDAALGKLVCVSCDRQGVRPVGLAELGGHEELNVSFTDTYPFYLPNNLSEDGSRVFFESRDPLVLRDSNGLLDVYEWEQQGTGSCTPSASGFDSESGGCVFPISDVAGAHESHFMDASASGENVFIATSDPLVQAAEGETRVNVYDVRVGGGFPVPVVSMVCVNADACKPPVSSQPSIYGAPASATFSGSGNTVPGPVVAPVPGVGTVKKVVAVKKVVRCKRGLVRKRGRCVRKSKPGHERAQGGHSSVRGRS